MEYAIYKSAAMTLIFVLASIWEKKKSNYFMYALVFVITFILTYSLSGNASEFKPRYNWATYVDHSENTYENYKWFEDTIWTHLMEAEECMIEAKEISVFLPDTNDREKARYCLTVLMAGFCPNTPQIKITAMALAFLADYIPACTEEFQRVVYLVEKAHYHTEMAIFYNNVFRHIFGESQF